MFVQYTEKSTLLTHFPARKWKLWCKKRPLSFPLQMSCLGIIIALQARKSHLPMIFSCSLMPRLGSFRVLGEFWHAFPPQTTEEQSLPEMSCSYSFKTACVCRSRIDFAYPLYSVLLLLNHPYLEVRRLLYATGYPVRGDMSW
jgi:hypothetical protein